MFVWQDGPRAYLVASDNIELTDVDIFDITNPRAPVMVGDHDLVELFPQILDGEEPTAGRSSSTTWSSSGSTASRSSRPTTGTPATSSST